MGDHAQDRSGSEKAHLNASVPIAAIATAPGRGGIGVIRASGKDLSAIVAAILGRPLAPRVASYLPFRAADGSVIDRGIAILFRAPHSYTGEEVLELQGHGGPVIMQLLLRRVLEAGREMDMRLAQPGEFTLRAYLNDKIDLAQAEAVADLIDASTEQAARSASRSLSGEFSQRVHALVQGLIQLRMLVEATLDFPEEELEFLQAERAQQQLALLNSQVAELLRQANQGALLRNGLNVVLAGEPNVGKSSLLNALAGAEVAIVTPVAGTTRDKVVQVIQIDGVPVNIIDTAGLRESEDLVERIGIARTWEELGRADVVLHLMDAAEDVSADVTTDVTTDVAADASESKPLADEIRARLPAKAKVLAVYNKIDLTKRDPQRIAGQSLWLSARTGDGIDLLRAELLALAGWQGAGESLFIARERHVQAIAAASAALERAMALASDGARHLELLAEELRLAQLQLASITGEFTADDLLGVIFSQFCIGK
jgi:tRNA modification GTPase